MAQAPAKGQTAEKKSGIKTFKAGEVLFAQGDPADSLFIIQTGQIRLYLPKGRGFVDLAILRAGEVIGEMAYFDESASRRSCSAAAIMNTQVIEISFKAFGKTMEGLNPWFKTIINTLADRLRKTNDKVKSLESNSIGFGKEGKVGDYVFFHNTDVLKLLSLFYLGFKTHGEKKESHVELHMNKLKFYMQDIFAIPEIKYEEFFLMLANEGFVKIANDEDGLPKMIQIRDIESMRSIMVFINMQRMMDASKQLKISHKCEQMLQKLITQLLARGEKESEAEADFTAVLEECNEEGVQVSEDDIKDAVVAGFVGDVMVGEQNRLSVTVYFDKLKKVFPSLRFSNAVKRLNESKAAKGY